MVVPSTKVSKTYALASKLQQALSAKNTMVFTIRLKNFIRKIVVLKYLALYRLSESMQATLFKI